MLGHMAILFHFLRRYHPVFYSGYTNFIPNEQGTMKSLPLLLLLRECALSVGHHAACQVEMLLMLLPHPH